MRSVTGVREEEFPMCGRRKERVSRRRSECRGNTARARKWRREPREIYDKEENKMIAITKHADKRIKERVPGMKSAEKRIRFMAVSAAVAAFENSM